MLFACEDQNHSNEVVRDFGYVHSTRSVHMFCESNSPLKQAITPILIFGRKEKRKKLKHLLKQ